MQLLHIISALAVGGIVGYITNYIAIKMLFRPLKPVMIGSFRVPFTPGIVPKRKDALAEILGRAIVDKFFNADDLEIVFKSDAFANAFSDCVVSLLTDGSAKLGNFCINNDEMTNRQIYGRFREELCIRIQAAILRADLSGLLADAAGKIIESRATGSRIGKVLNGDILPLVTEPLADKLEKYILTEGRAVILPVIDDELNELGAVPVAEITAGIFPDSSVLHDIAHKLYGQFMGRYVRRIVESIDVGGMITEKVKQMTAGEVESLVLAVVNRELRYVVLLGALIGMLIGAVNIFI